jgi:drug/metabolite transporter (DMT)-like permease
MHGQNAFLNTDSDTTRWLLAAAGPITAIPLLLFASGARQIPLSMLGLLQYLAPTMQFLLGVWLFHEAFTADRLVGLRADLGGAGAVCRRRPAAQARARRNIKRRERANFVMGVPVRARFYRILCTLIFYRVT